MSLTNQSNPSSRPSPVYALHPTIIQCRDLSIASRFNLRFRFNLVRSSLVESKLQIRTRLFKYFDEYKYGTDSKDKLHEVKDEWAGYMFTNVIPSRSWKMDFLKT